MPAQNKGRHVAHGHAEFQAEEVAEAGGVAQNADLAFAMGRTLANSTTWPTWGAGAEFKALRDATAAARK